MEAKVRDEILDRVMKVLVQEEGGKMVLSEKVKRIMRSKRYPNVRRIDENASGEEDEKASGEEEEEASEEDGDSFSESEEALQMSISAEQQHLQSFSEDPRTPSPSDYLPDDIFPKKKCNRISAERPQEYEEPLPSPSDYIPDGIFPRQKCNRISAERPQEYDEPLPSPSDYIPDGIFPQQKCNRISAERPTFQQSSNTGPPRKRSAKPQLPPKEAKKKPNHVTYVKMESPEEYKQNIRKRIDEVLKKASAGGDLITYEMYEKAVIEQPRKGSEVLLRRDIDEIFINNYNSEWIVDWDANIDISPVYDYYGTITYITDYFTKVCNNIKFTDKLFDNLKAL